MTIDIIKVIAPAALAFACGILITPILTHYLYAYKVWKKKSVIAATDGKTASISAQLHNDEARKLPRMGGIVVWMSGLVTILIFFLLSFLEGSAFEKFNFLS